MALRPLAQELVKKTTNQLIYKNIFIIGICLLLPVLGSECKKLLKLRLDLQKRCVNKMKWWLRQILICKSIMLI